MKGAERRKTSSNARSHQCSESPLVNVETLPAKNLTDCFFEHLKGRRVKRSSFIKSIRPPSASAAASRPKRPSMISRADLAMTLPEISDEFQVVDLPMPVEDSTMEADVAYVESLFPGPNKDKNVILTVDDERPSQQATRNHRGLKQRSRSVDDIDEALEADVAYIEALFGVQKSTSLAVYDEKPFRKSTTTCRGLKQRSRSFDDLDASFYDGAEPSSEILDEETKSTANYADSFFDHMRGRAVKRSSFLTNFSRSCSPTETRPRRPSVFSNATMSIDSAANEARSVIEQLEVKEKHLSSAADELRNAIAQLEAKEQVNETSSRASNYTESFFDHMRGRAVKRSSFLATLSQSSSPKTRPKRPSVFASTMSVDGTAEEARNAIAQLEAKENSFGSAAETALEQLEGSEGHDDIPSRASNYTESFFDHMRGRAVKRSSFLGTLSRSITPDRSPRRPSVFSSGFDKLEATEQVDLGIDDGRFSGAVSIESAADEALSVIDQLDAKEKDLDSAAAAVRKALAQLEAKEHQVDHGIANRRLSSAVSLDSAADEALSVIEQLEVKEKHLGSAAAAVRKALAQLEVKEQVDHDTNSSATSLDSAADEALEAKEELNEFGESASSVDYTESFFDHMRGRAVKRSSFLTTLSQSLSPKTRPKRPSVFLQNNVGQCY